jgi:hypothetical protein
MQTFLDAMPDDEGENDRRLVGAKTRPLNQALPVRSSLG